MRHHRLRMPLALALLSGLVFQAHAQPAVPIGPSDDTPPAMAPQLLSPPPGTLRAPTGVAPAQTPPPLATTLPPPVSPVPVAGPPTASYVRPGNVIGTGQSLPLSDRSSNITPSDTQSAIAPRLPTPAIGEDAPPAAFLRAARAALAAGRTGEAQEALERAESRALDRAVRPSQAQRPSGQRLVSQIAEARGALSTSDRPRALAMIDAALRDAEAGIR